MDKDDVWWPLWRPSCRKVNTTIFTQTERLQKVSKERIWKLATEQRPSTSGWIGSALRRRLKKMGAEQRRTATTVKASSSLIHMRKRTTENRDNGAQVAMGQHF